MIWYHYLACFLAGMFLFNAVPHFVSGICGNFFPTPFAKPPGKGLSSPPMNVVWALANMVIGYVLLQVGHPFSGGNVALLLFFAGTALISVMLSMTFQHKHTRP